ncbi:MAG: epoxyqueuosine reductase [Candidatus Izemoplasmatales bacterium]
MKLSLVLDRLLAYFDDARYLSSKVYEEEIIKRYHHEVSVEYPSIFVVSLSYPKRLVKHQGDSFISSNYTFGLDYHIALKKRMQEAMSSIPLEYKMYVDNHPLDERLAAELSGIGYLGKNQLIIRKNAGTYHFLGLLVINQVFENHPRSLITDTCGTCTKCIDACPGKALSEDGYIRDHCISSYNQEKRVLSIDEISKNYLLFGCDICQLVCPKNKDLQEVSHHDFDISGKEYVHLSDLVNLSSKQFEEKYHSMAYLWKGKNLLLRNAVTLLHNQKAVNQLDLLKSLLHKDYPEYLKDTIRKTIDRFEIIIK